jgi:peptidoglycan/xylan/chitin deacetylase (PgdA/CDA1 family)
MYHRFEENKYPSTNIRIKDFKQHIELIKKQGFEFINANEFEKKLINENNKKKILLTIDDGFLSFYNNAWPILKKEKIPFILFVSTREVGKHNYMSWDQIKEISKSNFAHIGNHSHTHEYLVDMTKDEIQKDLNYSISIFKKKLNKNSLFFSYPFGEYSLPFKKIVKELGFKFAFGQHSGVIDNTKDFLELPRFPINEKYGEVERFKTLLKTLPLQYKKISPEEKYLLLNDNPPKIIVEFFENQSNLNLINCYSNEQNEWRKSQIIFPEKNIMEIQLQGKFTTERGRVNCSLRNKNGNWRWLGLQFTIADIK